MPVLAMKMTLEAAARCAARADALTRSIWLRNKSEHSAIRASERWTHCEFLEAELDGGGHVGVGSDAERFKRGQRDQLVQSRMVLDSHPATQHGREDEVDGRASGKAAAFLTFYSRDRLMWSKGSSV